MSYLLPREQVSSITEVNSSSDIMEPLMVKDRLIRQQDYGSTSTCQVSLENDDKVVVSDQVMVSAVANLSTAVCFICSFGAELVLILFVYTG